MCRVRIRAGLGAESWKKHECACARVKCVCADLLCVYAREREREESWVKQLPASSPRRCARVCVCASLVRQARWERQKPEEAAAAGVRDRGCSGRGADAEAKMLRRRRPPNIEPIQSRSPPSHDRGVRLVSTYTYVIFSRSSSSRGSTPCTRA